ncbi:Hypothetical predicted protein [Pelobates cultripes]|uniref:Helix-turn-helix domain-containing protein n=1 Tax=Pelobates cultripes TaxID=61616 RepID=A0AAD1VL48_PELCU|nr:Hypothetical predicted protein [Pelobates cultripes]
MTSTISSDKVHYLDLEISVNNGSIQYCLYTKPSDRNTILHATSAHPKALLKSLPKAQYLRVIRNNSNLEVMEKQITSMTQKFLNRGYPLDQLQEALHMARHNVAPT